LFCPRRGKTVIRPVFASHRSENHECCLRTDSVAQGDGHKSPICIVHEEELTEPVLNKYLARDEHESAYAKSLPDPPLGKAVEREVYQSATGNPGKASLMGHTRGQDIQSCAYCPRAESTQNSLKPA
jgi:hypothetical protein